MIEILSLSIKLDIEIKLKRLVDDLLLGFSEEEREYHAKNYSSYWFD